MILQLLIVCWILQASVGTDGVRDYVYIGCYTDDSQNDQLVHQYVTSADDDTSRCLVTCQQQGFPFAGIHSGGENCSCTNSYGKYSESDNCVYDCYENGFPECGGDTAYSIYYTVSTAESCPASSVNVHRPGNDVCLSMTTGLNLNFTEARTKCVESGCDLAAITGESTREGIMTLIDEASIGNTVLWIGLKRDTENGSFQWSSALESQYNHSVYKHNFMSGLTGSNLCAALNTTSALWETHACDEALPFVCMATLSKPDTQKNRNAFMKFMDPIIEFYSNDNNMATYLVLPVFVVLMVSCCLPYICHRVRKNRKQTSERVTENKPKVAEVTGKYTMNRYYFGTSNDKQPFCLY